MQSAKHEHWSSGFTFLLAAVGSAVGLGNIWRFPYVVGENGGGAFVIIYLAIVFLIGIPLLMTELSIGRKTQASPVTAMTAMGKGSKIPALWTGIGWSYLLVPLGILSFYTVVAGWTLDYVVGMGMGDYNDLAEGQTQEAFGELLGNPGRMIFWMTLAVGITAGIVARGIKSGLEKAVEILMPTLFVILIILVLYASFTGNFLETVAFMFQPDFSKITSETVLMAAGQAFFSLSLGSGAIMVYGSYLTRDISIPKMAVGVALADTSVALLAGFAIFPIVFSSGLEHAAGPGLVFVTLPIVFDTMPFGQLFGVLFFMLLAFAAISSTISLLEPMVAHLAESGKVKRARAALYTGAGVWSMGILAAMSNNILSDFYPLAIFKTFESKTIMDLLDYFSANVFMLLNGLFVAIFMGWVVKRSDVLEELGLGDALVFKLWRVLIKVVAPLVVGYIFIEFIRS